MTSVLDSDGDLVMITGNGGVPVILRKGCSYMHIRKEKEN